MQVTNKKASALISVYAGQVLSFKPVSEVEDILFFSEIAYFREGKAMRGGIPICWPWFGDAPEGADLPSHGFVRNNTWKVSNVNTLENGDTKIKLEFTDDDNTQKIWPFQFYLSLEITISDSLTLNLTTQNKGNQAFTITEALHTYFNVGDANQIQVFGLEKAEYLDKAEEYIEVCQVGAITVKEAMDHIYINKGNNLTINDPVLKRRINISSSGNKNVVVWNPGPDGAEKMLDLQAEDYKRFVCVEIANTASNSVKIHPSTEYSLVTSYDIKPYT
ncbi:MAG: D-hexose-6-phosphate mutarotase [Methylococcales bacterium]